MRKRAIWMMAVALWVPSVGFALTGHSGDNPQTESPSIQARDEAQSTVTVPTSPSGWGIRGAAYQVVTKASEAQERREAAARASLPEAGSSRPLTPREEKRRHAKELVMRHGKGMPDWQELLLMGAGLCAGAAFCVYRASRVKRIGASARVLPMPGGVTA